MTEIRLVSKFFGNDQARNLAWLMENGGYTGARKALSMDPKDIVDEVIASNLRGLGGAGFPTGKKWTFVPETSEKPKYLAVNADEAEPGTFKDRYILEWDPHRLIEGIIICCKAVGIHTAYIYIRGEYLLPYQRLNKAVEEAYRENFLGPDIMGSGFSLDVHIHRGAGAYICGEETALLESLEGKRGWPRLKPPFPALEGAFGCPTVINNVETISHLPEIMLRGGKWFAGLGAENNGGTRLFAVSGCVKKPGVYELPLGTTMRELIYEHAGGIREDRALKGVIPGGTSSAVLTADEIDTPLTFNALAALGSMAGSGAVIVLDEDVCMVKALHNIETFFSHESCGQCTPCREGTSWVHKILSRIIEGNGQASDMDTLRDFTINMNGTSICALCDGAVMAMKSFISKFEDEFVYFISNKRSLAEDRKKKRAGNSEAES